MRCSVTLLCHDLGTPMSLVDEDSSVRGQQQCSVGVLPVGSVLNQDAKLNNTLKLSDNVSMQERSEWDVATVTAGALEPKTAEPYSGACIHPFIQKMLIKMQKVSEADPNGQCEECTSPLEVDLSMRNCSNHQPMHSFYSNQNHELDDIKLEQLDEARGTGVLELCPEDEVEGEILYFQNKLLNTAVQIRDRCENMMLRVVGHLPEELDALKKRRWDLVVVNQFLRHVKEAKKRGRKEKRHREYQAVLAAAAAAVETSSRVSSLRKETNDDLLSSRQEVVAGGVRTGTCPLTSRAKETPSKLALPKISSERQPETSSTFCDVCGRAETMLNRIFVCGGCKVAVHLDCYRRPRNPISSWFCEVCEELQSNSSSQAYLNVDDREKPCFVAHCGLCNAATGAFRKTVNGQWVHSFCAEWVLESTFRRGQENPVEGMESVLKAKEMLNCCICHQNNGICIKCSFGHCQIAFHPFCARSVGLFMSVRTVNSKLQHKAYCEKHGTEQRRKADIQQYGAEELKSIKQIRVELEKVRLLCERIIRREKLKRELVLCSHDILASRRDYVAFSVLVNSSFFPPGVSSESATTSINNRSYSDTIQRSDDITVDSSVPVKRKVRLPLQMDTDRRTEDSSTSRLVSARKGTGRMAFSGKQIPHRPASVTSHSSVDGEKRLKPRKHMEIFQKEVVMTSDQASIQNRRLPKGFVYVPVDSLPKTRNIETHEPRKPDG
uniref:NuA3 HAT complex component NTO1 n=1 Tax=Anthurium amnicola TaxID=1678845 RepID=A0A1D1YFP8_9ARAE